MVELKARPVGGELVMLVGTFFRKFCLLMLSPWNPVSEIECVWTKKNKKSSTSSIALSSSLGLDIFYLVQ